MYRAFQTRMTGDQCSELPLAVTWYAMPEDFETAAARHYHDAVLLDNHDRVSNADQLYGFAAECAIKKALAESPGSAAGLAKFRQHIDTLWELACTQSIHRRHPKLVTVLKGLNKPFQDWSTDRRYESDDAVTRAVLERHRNAVRRVLGSVGLLGAKREA